MSIANVLVHASHREGFPNVVLQAGAMELPIVCSNIPGNIDIVENATGNIFPVTDTKALKEAVMNSFVSMNNAIAKSTKLRKRIENNFNRKLIHQLLLDYYKTKLH